MHYEPYRDLVALTDLSVFQFFSEGSRGRIAKQIRFIKLPREGRYSLELGDINECGVLDRSSISNNGDRDRVLATVIQAVEIYTKKYPDRTIIIEGLTESRGRLFRMVIGANLKQLSTIFTVRAELREKLLLFKRGIDSTSFELKRKKSVCRRADSLADNKSRLFQQQVAVQLDDAIEISGIPGGSAKGNFIIDDRQITKNRSLPAGLSI